MGRRNLRTGETASIRPQIGRPAADSAGPASSRPARYRFNWNTPFILSHHNSRIFYAAGNYRLPLARPRQRPAGDLARDHPDRQAAAPRRSAESPRNPNVL